MRDRSSASCALLAGLMSSGCFASSSAPPGQEGPEDAETQTVADATTVQEAAAPVQDATVAIEAGLPEAAPEASVPEAGLPEAAVEAGPAPVTVTVVNHLGPESGVYIVFQDVNGNVVDTATTNDLGQVTQLLGAATQVTALTGAAPPMVTGLSAAVRRGVAADSGETDAAVEVIPSPATVNLVTVQGVEPGDNLSLFDPSDTTESSATINVDSVPDGGPGGTQSYVVSAGGCPLDGYSNAALPLELGLTSNCESNGTFPVLVLAQAGPDAGYAVIGYTWQDGNTIPLDGGMANVVMTGPWETATTTQTITAENIPSTGLPYSVYSELANNVATPSTEGLAGTGMSTVAVTFAGHPAFATAVQNEVGQTSNGDGLFAQTAIATRGPFVGDSGVTLDLSTALPLINWVVQDAGFPTSDAAVPPSGQPYAAWGTDAGSLASVSGVVVQFSWYDEGENGQNYGTWTIVAPPTATSVTAPALPPQLSLWGVAPSVYFNQAPIVAAVQSSALPTYTAFRNQFAALPITAGFTSTYAPIPPLIPALPAAGTIKVTAVTTAGE
jgi:hypothetical protein